MSFSEAFGAARNETGPGGIFLWKGGVYGTYYRDEWSQLSPEYKQTFSDYPYHQPEASHTADINSADEPAIAATASEDDQPDEQQTAEATDDAATAEELQTAEVTGDATTAEELQTAEVTDDAATAEDVEVLGIQYTEIDGQMVAVAPISVDGREGLLIDVDADGIFDYTVSDNGTGNPDMEDISGDRITYNDVTGFQETPHSAANTEAYPIADEQIPDYTNNVPIDDYTV
jgi:cytoskeletal protein RodZ